MSARAPHFEGSPYKAPKGAVARFLWRWKMWAEATFALSMMERWEKLVVWTIFASVALLFVTGLYQYLPSHLDFLRKRSIYYFLGDESESTANAYGGGASDWASGGK